ncbi:GrpB family protein [Nocardioides sp.]|uniref:GrpB family protein n=1 Tax=Nocardioides sp. TaxID=35761 RepID=UPI00271A9DDB|nr:GrpB family protein [Nocardioides sp.]MDO9457529.1 GrpB family protein [Nocardioides sp.]
MPTHPLWSPYETVSDEDIAAARVGVRTPERVEVVAPDPRWPSRFADVRQRIVDALGDRALSVEHVGSTSVPGLWAKPVIDVDLVVASSADEPAYLPDLEAAGFELRVREPEWQEHRLVRCLDPQANVHVFSPDAMEPRRHLAFRDWLRTHEDDRAAYAATKREVAGRGHSDSMHYNNEKAWVVYDLYEKIFAADPAHAHDPQPRA